MTPRRLKPQQRREQLLDTAATMFAEKPYDDVLHHDIFIGLLREHRCCGVEQLFASLLWL